MATTKLWTIEELETGQAPEGRWELIEGELVEMPPSSRRSSRIGSQFVTELSIYVRPRGLGEVHGAEGGFVIFPQRPMLRIPDAAFVRADRLIGQAEERLLHLAPDLVVEVISPNDRLPDVLAKVEMWLDAGVRLVWLVDPAARTVTVHEPGHAPWLVHENESLTGGVVLPGFRFSLNTVDWAV
jgi:Uma2 family endonuclease